VFGSDAAFIVAKDHVHHPMQAVLDGPVTSHDGAEAVGRQDQRCDAIARLVLGFAFDFTLAIDDGDAVQARPIMALALPGDIVDDGGGSGLDAAVIAVDGFIAAGLGVPETAAFLTDAEKYRTRCRRVSCAAVIDLDARCRLDRARPGFAIPEYERRTPGRRSLVAEAPGSTQVSTSW
jgi:hypothetical protein